MPGCVYCIQCFFVIVVEGQSRPFQCVGITQHITLSFHLKSSNVFDLFEAGFLISSCFVEVGEVFGQM